MVNNKSILDKIDLQSLTNSSFSFVEKIGYGINFFKIVACICLSISLSVSVIYLII